MRANPTRVAWEERLVFFLLFAGTAGLWWARYWLNTPQLLFLFTTLMLLVAVLARLGEVKLFGPVLYYDMVRTARRSRYILYRFLFGLILFAVLVWLNYIWNVSYPQLQNEDRLKHLARMAEACFATFMTVQMLAVILLTPAFTAGAIAEEKDRRTLEFILATDLENREIILSKLASRLLSLTFLFLVGLPILSLMQFFGGVDPELTLAAYLAIGLTMISLASLSILVSIYARRTRDAIGLVYLMVLVYLVLLPALDLILTHALPGAIGALPLWFGEEPLTLLALVEILNRGNIFMAYTKLAVIVGSGRSLAAGLETVLEGYIGFHLVFTALCITWAVRRLRVIALNQASEAARTKPTVRALRWSAPWRPPVGDMPMIWKEVHAEPGVRMSAASRAVLGVVILASFIPPGWMLWEYLWPSGRPTFSRREEFQIAVNIWVRIAGTAVACLLLLSIAIRASGSITGERDRQTMDGLLTTPLGSEEIFLAKWWGSLCSARWGLIWLVLTWVVGVVLRGLVFYAVPLLIITWSVLAACFAAIGMWYSTTSKTTQRATMMTLMVTLFVGGLNWFVLGMCCYVPVAHSMRPGDAVERVMEFHVFGLTPPITLGWLAFEGSEFQRQNSDSGRFLQFAIWGLFVWFFAALCVYAAGNERFRVVSGRERFRRGRLPPESLRAMRE
jgi:ABC-type transport system involved in multi-copper enzyme maturation permease subunit